MGFQLGYGANLADALLYLAFELGFVIVPGWLAYRALSRQPGGPLRQLAMGWALGYVLEILAFMLTAEIGARDLFMAYPVVVGVTAAAIVRRRPSLGSSDSDAAAAAIHVGAGRGLRGGCRIHRARRLPRDASARDAVRELLPRLRTLDCNRSRSQAPLADRRSECGRRAAAYHYFVNVHLAASSQVTGIDLPLIYLRLFLLPLVVLAVLSLVVAGQTFARSATRGWLRHAWPSSSAS